MLVCSFISFWNPGDLIKNIDVLSGISSLGVGWPSVVPNDVLILSIVFITISPIPLGILDSLLGFPMLSLPCDSLTTTPLSDFSILLFLSRRLPFPPSLES
jgi:hypothetical protein